MTIEFIASYLGANTGPFSFYSDVDGYTVPFAENISKEDLMSGIQLSVPDFTIEVKLVSTGVCPYEGFITPIPATTTTSTTLGTTTTTTTLLEIPCSVQASYGGGLAYPSSRSINLGTGTGQVDLYFDPDNIPDRWIVRWNGNIVIDTGYRSQSMALYNPGGFYRNNFKNSLTRRIDPVLGTTYPDFANFPVDGYPLMQGPGEETTLFFKTLPNPTNAIVEVYAPQGGTGWRYTMYCPVEPTTTTTTTTVV